MPKSQTNINNNNDNTVPKVLLKTKILEAIREYLTVDAGGQNGKERAVSLYKSIQASETLEQLLKNFQVHIARIENKLFFNYSGRLNEKSLDTFILIKLASEPLIAQYFNLAPTLSATDSVALEHARTAVIGKLTQTLGPTQNIKTESWFSNFTLSGMFIEPAQINKDAQKIVAGSGFSVKKDSKLLNTRAQNTQAEVTRIITENARSGHNFYKPASPLFGDQNQELYKNNWKHTDEHGHTLLHKYIITIIQMLPAKMENLNLFEQIYSNAIIEEEENIIIQLLSILPKSFINQTDNYGYTAFDYAMLSSVEYTTQLSSQKPSQELLDAFQQYGAVLSPSAQEKYDDTVVINANKKAAALKKDSSAPAIGENTLFDVAQQADYTPEQRAQFNQIENSSAPGIGEQTLFDISHQADYSPAERAQFNKSEQPNQQSSAEQNVITNENQVVPNIYPAISPNGYVSNTYNSNYQNYPFLFATITPNTTSNQAPNQQKSNQDVMAYPDLANLPSVPTTNPEDSVTVVKTEDEPKPTQSRRMIHG